MNVLHRLGDAAARLVSNPPDLFLLLLLMAAATAWIWLAARASEQAEGDGRSPAAHFLLGLLIPFAWAFLMPRRTASPAAADVGGFPETEPAPAAGAEMEPAADESAAPEPPAPGVFPAAAGDVGPEYFLELIRSRAVTMNTPCRIRRDDGSAVTVVGIVEARPEQAVVKFLDAAGSAQTIRIPYARIRSVEPLSGEGA